MWFKNILIYQFSLDKPENLQQNLAEEALKPCPPHARFIYGWLPVMANLYSQEITDAALICMGKEERVLPRSVINRLLIEKIQEIETREGRTIKRAEKSQLAEDLEFELLPKSFCIQKKCYAILDFKNHRLLINTSSENQATQLTALLRKSIPGIQIHPLGVVENLATRFTNWIANPETMPTNFQLAANCILFSPLDEKKKVQCKGYELPATEISTLLAQGLQVDELSLLWNERIQLSLTQDFVLKRIQALDYLVEEFAEVRDLEEEYQQQDAALTLLSGELRLLIDAFMMEFGIAALETTQEPEVMHS